MSGLRLSPGAMRIALIVSLALNLAGAGLLVGWALGPDRHDRHGPHLPPLLRALPEADRDALRGELRGAIDRRAQRADRRAAQERVAAAVLADPFDRAALEAALAGMRAGNDRLAQRLDAGFADAVERMDAQARAALVRRLLRSRR